MSTVKIPDSNVAAIECKYVAYQEALDGSKDDMMLVKEVVHTKDNRQVPRKRLIENFKRPVYITKPNRRNHQDKKEYEHIDNLDRYDCNQARLSETIQRGLGRRIPNPKLRLADICKDPYVYFADMASPTLYKAMYKRKYPDAVSRNRVAVLDIETDVVFGTGEPIMVAVTVGEKKIIAVADWWAKKVPDFQAKLEERFKYHLSSIDIPNKKGVKEKRDLIKERGGDLIIISDKNIALGFKEVMDQVHEWMPDFLAVWNLDFDLPKLMAICDKYGVSHEDVWCDPMVPPKYRNVWYKQAKSVRETNSKKISQHPADLWHVLFTMAGFYVIDAMAAFKKVRVAAGNEPDYKLDGVLGRHLGIGKLRVEGVKAVEGDIKWHVEMQKEKPVDYCVYNLFDCISVELLDEKTNDLGVVIPVLADISEYSIFPSLPKRLVDILSFFYIDRNLVPGTCGAAQEDIMDEGIVELSGWIVTLPAHMVQDNGLKCVKDLPDLITTFYAQVGDDDIKQAYPTGEIIMNISKETTAIEIKSIQGVSDAARRRSGINLTGGQVNAIEIANELFNKPSIHDVLPVFMDDLERGLV